MELVEVRLRCQATSVLRGFAPTFTLRAEGGPSGSLLTFYHMTYYPNVFEPGGTRLNFLTPTPLP